MSQVRQAEAGAGAFHVCERAEQGGHMLAEVGVIASALGPRAGSSHQAPNDLTACSVVIACGEWSGDALELCHCGVTRGGAAPDFTQPVGLKRGSDMAVRTRGSP